MCIVSKILQRLSKRVKTYKLKFADGRRSTMNRAQRRKSQKDQRKKHFSGQAAVATEQPDFSGVPLATMCQSIQLLINELYSRGYPVFDFDNKDKFIQGIQIIQGKVYFLAAMEDLDNEKV